MMQVNSAAVNARQDVEKQQEDVSALSSRMVEGETTARSRKQIQVIMP